LPLIVPNESKSRKQRRRRAAIIHTSCSESDRLGRRNSQEKDVEGLGPDLDDLSLPSRIEPVKERRNIAWTRCCTSMTPITIVYRWEDLVSEPRNHAAWWEPVRSAAAMELGGVIGREAAGKSPTDQISSARLYCRADLSIARRRAWHRQSPVAGRSFPVGTTGKLCGPDWVLAGVTLVERSAWRQICRRRGVRPLSPRHCRDVPPPSHGTVARSDRFSTGGRFRSADRNDDVRRRSLCVHDRTARRT
jgi:hypothetical protein